MPVATDEDLKKLAREGKLRIISVDTSIFHQKNYKLEREPLASLVQFSDSYFSFVLSAVIIEEITAHIEQELKAKENQLLRALGDAISSWSVPDQNPRKIIENLLGSREAKEVAKELMTAFIEKTGCEIISPSVSIEHVLGMYFGGAAPFGTGKKKSEFPDAIALSSLEEEGRRRGIAILAVSTDEGWVEFAERSDIIYVVKSLETGLSILQRSDDGFANFLLSESEESQEFKRQLFDLIERDVLDWYFDVDAHSSARVESSVYGIDVEEIYFTEPTHLSFLHVDYEKNHFSVSIPISIHVKLGVSFDFFVYDSEDKTELHLNSISDEIDHVIHTNVVAEVIRESREEPRFSIWSVDTASADINIDCGYVDPF